MPGEVVLEVKNMCQPGVFDHVSFNLRKGEILGVAGLMGAGRTEIMRALFGIDGCQQGEIYLHGEKVTIKKPEDAIKAGIGFITENRKTEGLILDFSILKNIALPSVDTFATKAVINDKKEYDFSNDLSHKLGVKTASIQRQPAEGRYRKMDWHAPVHHHHGRTYTRHRRRRQARYL